MCAGCLPDGSLRLRPRERAGDVTASTRDRLLVATGQMTDTNVEGMARPLIAPETETLERERDDLVPLYRVVLLDDNDHTYDYVIEMLQKIFIFSLDQAYRHAEEVDRCGRTVVITCELPAAEFARDQIHAYGPDWRLERSKGSMSAEIERA
jgi:ATP-dependent Clp protease adaptor protein ClpS